jgi:glycosyltransferase involved in cell wall biosynthesis
MNMKKFELSILIPAYNDCDTIGEVIKEADRVAKKIASNYEIRVINDASRDDTQRVLQKLSKNYPKLIWSSHQVNAGYGGTIKELYESARYDWQFSVPGDNQYSPAEVEKLIPYKGKADMIIGWRVNRHDPPSRLRQSYIYNSILRFLYQISTRDVNSVRLMKTEIIRHIKLTSTSAFVDAELVIDAKDKGFKIIEIPIDHKSRQSEDGAGGGSLKTILPTIKDMLRYFLVRR